MTDYSLRRRLLLGLTLAAPAAAQELIPHGYEAIPEGGLIKPAPQDKPAERIAAEQATANSAEAACNTGCKTARAEATSVT